VQSSSTFRTAGTLTDETIADHIDDLEEIIGNDAYDSFLTLRALRSCFWPKLYTLFHAKFFLSF
jgi:hypothetical protein